MRLPSFRRYFWLWFFYSFWTLCAFAPLSRLEVFTRFRIYEFLGIWLILGSEFSFSHYFSSVLITFSLLCDFIGIEIFDFWMFKTSILFWFSHMFLIDSYAIYSTLDRLLLWLWSRRSSVLNLKFGLWSSSSIMELLGELVKFDATLGNLKLWS